jgi:two-component system chemotaxis response regulator CheB
MTAARRVLLVDDSPVVLSMVEAALRARPSLEVVGAVGSAEAAIRGLHRYRPDLVLMDANMPGMDGIEGTKAIRARSPVRVVLMTGSSGAEFRRFQVVGLSAGAFSVLQKDGVNGRGFYDQVERLASEGCGRLPSQQEAPGPGEAPRIHEAPSGPTRAPAPSPSPARSARPAPRVIGVVSSTGGPQTLLRALRPLPRSFPCAVVLVQHMSDGFDHSFRDMLAAHLQLEVRLAEDGDPLVAGQLLVAAPGAHMVTAGDRVRLDPRSPAEANHKPSGNKLLNSLAISHGKSAWGIVLTGMGDDGAAGLLAMRRAGCHTIAQDAASAILDGMPKRARELGAAEAVLSDLEIGPYLLQQVLGRS